MSKLTLTLFQCWSWHEFQCWLQHNFNVDLDMNFYVDLEIIFFLPSSNISMLTVSWTSFLTSAWVELTLIIILFVTVNYILMWLWPTFHCALDLHFTVTYISDWWAYRGEARVWVRGLSDQHGETGQEHRQDRPGYGGCWCHIHEAPNGKT